jgi:ElaB/YqjD/DUF883 family membrane-anchored ribosome-binding protein
MEDQSHVHDESELGHERRSTRERAGQLKATLADRLDTSAEKLRQRTTDTAKLDRALALTKERVADVSDHVATRMESTAEWLREANMASVQRRIEKQVRENPTRALLIAAGVGFVLGRAIWRRES